MHYANGRQAAYGDPVIYKGPSGIVAAGTLHSLCSGTECCNGQIAIAVPGGTSNWCVTVGECWHAEDALAAAAATLTAPPVAPPVLLGTPAADPAPASEPAPKESPAAATASFREPAHYEQ